MGNLTMAPEDWLEELFKWELCLECHGDAEDHTAIPFLGNWFARCSAEHTCRLDECDREDDE